jgi:glycosyltransferase involved in cell wall biosynthesis
LQTLFIIFIIAASIQAVYFIFFIVALTKKRVHQAGEAKAVSVVVCAHDEEHNLKELIPILLAQKHRAFEVIIVNDRSNDGTYDFLLEETKKTEQLRMVHVASTPQHVNGKKYGITLGIKAAKYDWIILTDADCRPNSDKWLQTVSEKCYEDKEIVLGYSPYKKESGFLNLFIRFETLFTGLQYVAYAILGNPYMGVGRNLAYRKALFLDNKGFSGFLQVTGGDDDLFVNQHAVKANTTLSLGEESLVFSFPKKTWSSFFQQKIRHLAVGKKYKVSHRLLLGIFSGSHAITWFTGVPLLIFFSGFFWVLGALVFRVILFIIATHQAAKQFGHKFESWAVPFLDFLFVIYYLSTAPVALVTKRIQWKN